MNILTDALPDIVTVNGVKYAVLTDFRIWMEFDRIIHQNEISTRDKLMMIVRLCLDYERCKLLPEDIMEKEGMIHLEPGAVYRNTYTITVG